MTALIATLLTLTYPQRGALARAIIAYVDGSVAFSQLPALTSKQAGDIAARLVMNWSKDAPLTTEQDLAVLRWLPRLPYTIPENGRDRAVLARAFVSIGALNEASTTKTIPAAEAAIEAILNPEPLVAEEVRFPARLGYCAKVHGGVTSKCQFHRTGGGKHLSCGQDDGPDASIPKIEAMMQAVRESVGAPHDIRAKDNLPLDPDDGDAECTECHRMYYSGTGHPTIALCHGCWKPEPKREIKDSAMLTGLPCTEPEAQALRHEWLKAWPAVAAVLNPVKGPTQDDCQDCGTDHAQDEHTRDTEPPPSVVTSAPSLSDLFLSGIDQDSPLGFPVPVIKTRRGIADPDWFRD